MDPIENYKKWILEPSYNQLATHYYEPKLYELAHTHYYLMHHVMHQQKASMLHILEKIQGLRTLMPTPPDQNSFTVDDNMDQTGISPEAASSEMQNDQPHPGPDVAPPDAPKDKKLTLSKLVLVVTKVAGSIPLPTLQTATKAEKILTRGTRFLPLATLSELKPAIAMVAGSVPLPKPQAVAKAENL